MKSGVITSPVDMAARVALGLRAGDVVRVWQKIEELKATKGKNKKEVMTKNVRRQAFEGIVLAVKHGSEAGGSFTVRKVASGVGVEKIYPLYATTIDEVEVLRRTQTRRSKLYFIRRKAAREVSRAMRKQLQVNLPAKSEAAAVEVEAATAPQEEQSAA